MRPTALMTAVLLTGLMTTLLTPTASAETNAWVVYPGGKGPGSGKHIVFVTGDDEYRSEEGMPMLAKILSVRHGFKCTVLFAIDPETGLIKPDHQTNIPGLEALDTADLMVVFLRFRNLPDSQMAHIVKFTHSGKPIVALRTSTHAFNIGRNNQSKFQSLTFNSRSPKGGWGGLVLGDTWLNHHGHHGRESTRGVINPSLKTHAVLKGVTDIWGPTDVYGVRKLPGDAQVLVHGQVLAGMKPSDKPVAGRKNEPMMPLVWTRQFQTETGKTARVLATTMGASTDLQSAGLRRLLVNGCYWGLGLEKQITADSDVSYVGNYKPTRFGFGAFVKGIKPSDHALE
jgi:hypothetical protein